MSAEPRRRITSDTGPCAIVPLWLIESEVSDRALRVFAVLAAKWADKDDRAWPSLQTIGGALPMRKDARARVRRQRPNLRGSVIRAIKELEKAAAITVERQDKDQGPEVTGRPWERNMYVLHRVRPGMRTHATTPPHEHATTGMRMNAPEVVAGARHEPEGRNQTQVEPERLLDLWRSARRGLERYRFTDARALKTLRSGIDRAIANGQLADVEAAIREKAHESYANPVDLDEWVAAQVAQREEREQALRKSREREEAERDRDAAIEAERASLRRRYPGRSMREILEIQRPLDGPTPVGAVLERTP